VTLARMALGVAAALLSGASAAAPGCPERVEGRTHPPPATAAVAAAGSPCTALPPISLPASGRNWYASADADANGGAGGEGTREKPWALRAALAAPSSVRGGDTIWLAPGVYRGPFVSRLTGTPERPVVVRGLPGGRVALDGEGAHEPVLTIEGGYTMYRDFEVFNSRPSADADSSNVVSRAPGTRLVGLVIHDASSTGIGLWSEAPDSEIAGCLLFDNGRHANLDHGIYSQNRTGTKAIRDNVIVRSRAYGLHLYGSSSAALRRYCIEGNVLVDNGALVAGSPRSNAIVGGSAPTDDIEIRDNHFIESVDRNTNVRLGYGGPARGLDVRRNRFVGGRPALFVDGWTAPLVFERNVLSGGVRWKDTFAADSAGAFEEGLPPGPEVFVRRDPYDAHRARILVYADAQSGSGSQTRPGPRNVEIDLSPWVPRGSTVTVSDAFDWLGAPVSTSTYAGGRVSIPLGPRRLAKPAGLPEIPADSSPRAWVFLLRASAPGDRP